MLLLLGQRGCRITGELPQSSVAKYMVKQASKSGMADLCANHAPNIAVGFRYTQANPRTCRDVDSRQHVLTKALPAPSRMPGWCHQEQDGVTDLRLTVSRASRQRCSAEVMSAVYPQS